MARCNGQWFENVGNSPTKKSVTLLYRLEDTIIK